MRTFSTPMMQQYSSIREQYQDCMLFFRLGDFYELFLDDALEGAKILGITLTRRPRGKDGDIPMAGVPYHSADTYIAKLLKAGKKIAVCEQVSEPDNTGIVERKVVRIITPGTVLDDASLEQKRHNYIVSIEVSKKNIGVAMADLLTGDFHVTQFERDESEREKLGAHLLQFAPSECVVSEDTYNSPILLGLITAHHNPAVSTFAAWQDHAKDSSQKLVRHFSVAAVDSFGFGHLSEAVTAAATLLGYLNHTQQSPVTHLQKPVLFLPDEYVLLDPATITNLELFSTIQENNRDGSLLQAMDKTQTAAGGRLLRQWLLYPQKNLEVLTDRYDVITELYGKQQLRVELQQQLREVFDLERLLSRLALGMGSYGSVFNIKQSLVIFLELYPIISGYSLQLFSAWKKLPHSPIKKLHNKIESTLAEEETTSGEVIRVIKTGINAELDTLRAVVKTGTNWMADFETKERQRTGITTLKCRFNNVFGYYIEVSQSYLKQVPETYQRKQTLVNAERFITPELKEQEEKILAAKEKIEVLEREIFTELVNEVVASLPAIKAIAAAMAELDVLCSFAQIAHERRYIRPYLTTQDLLKIEGGKHPVLAQKLQEKFVPNDVTLDAQENQLLVITGPNMAGKSVFMRQVALLILMAQAGSFIPATTAQIPVVDRIFVRSGAADNISKGLSTFMVEMVEAATILNQATSKSLVIMDEIGRGTSTYDGISIAWAIAEYLVTYPTRRPKVLFATHYHELQALAEKYPQSIQNYQVLVEEHEDKPIFLYTVAPGAASHSFGIAVAKLAGLPKEILETATQLLTKLEAQSESSLNAEAPQHDVSKNKNYPRVSQAATAKTTKLDAQTKAMVQKIMDYNVSTTTPLEALQLLAELQAELKNTV